MAHRAPKAAKDVYRGYMPIDLPQHRPRQRFKPWWKVLGKPRVTLYPKTELEGYSDEPEYPPLNDGSIKGLKTQVRLDWYESLKKLPTAEMKMNEIGRHSTHYIAHINNWIPNYSSLDLIKYLTRTHLVNQLPDNYISKTFEGDHSVVEKKLLDKVRQIVLNQIALDNYESCKKAPQFVSKTIRDGNKEAHISNRSIQNLVFALKKVLSPEANPQLSDYQCDLSPAIRSWWYHSGFPAPNYKIFYKSRKDENGNINQMIQMDGSSALNLRGKDFIKPILPQTDPLLNDKTLVQDFSHPLKHYGAVFKFKWPVALPGFWYQDEPGYDFPHTCFLSNDCLKVRNRKKHLIAKPSDDDENCLNGQAILTAFGLTNSLSIYHGFTPFQEVEYPFTCQLVTTDGQNWLFNIYQMNCHTFHRDLEGPSKNNICWTSGMMKLYENYNDGNFAGVNDDVIKLIIRFLSQQTSSAYTSQLNLRPYLGVDERSLEEKEKTRKQLRDQIEGRRNQWLLHDWKVPLWEHIFFRSPVGRNRITHMKPRWHIPKPPYPKIFE